MPIKAIRPTRPALAAATTTLLLGGLAFAPQAGASTLYACVKKKTGTARFVSARTNCRRGETKLAWNTQGVAGKNGANGKNGAAGKSGATGKDGGAGKNGSNGLNGASTGLVDFNDTVTELPLTRSTVATLTVPAGSYVFLAKVQVEDANVTEAVAVHCYLAGNDEAVASLDPKGGTATLSLMTAGTAPLGSIITLECNDFGTSAVKVSFARLAAIQLQTLTQTAG
jgi:hypothetical protein